jgi:ADP-heptose:LPS heptosyltransferase
MPRHFPTGTAGNADPAGTFADPKTGTAARVWEHPAALAGPVIEWGRLRRVLLVRADNLGDVVMCGPALRALHRAAPTARLDLLAAPAGALAAPLLPEVAGVLPASVSWQQLDPAAVPVRHDLELVQRIADRGYDAVVLLTSFSQSPWPAAMLCRLAGVPLRIGLSKEFGGAALTHWVPAPPDGTHQVDRSLYLLRRVGVAPVDGRLHLAVPDAARVAIREILRGYGIRRYALLLPGASCPSRRYPAERFATVAVRLAAAGLPVVVAGTAGETDLVARVTTGATGAIGLAGVLDVPGLAAAVAGSRVVVCNNSGGAHLADALGTPVVVLFAGTEQASQYAPRSTRATVLTVPTRCAPCRQLRCRYHLECLDLAPELVAEQALRAADRESP